MFTKSINEIVEAVNNGEVLLAIEGHDVHTHEVKEEEGFDTWGVITKGKDFPAYTFNMDEQVVVGEDADDIAYATNLDTGKQVVMSLVTKNYQAWSGE